MCRILKCDDYTMTAIGLGALIERSDLYTIISRFRCQPLERTRHADRDKYNPAGRIRFQ